MSAVDSVPARNLVTLDLIHKSVVLVLVVAILFVVIFREGGTSDSGELAKAVTLLSNDTTQDGWL